MAKITDLPAANSIDATADVFPIVTSNINTTQKISRNTFLGLASAPLGTTDVQSPTNKTFDNTSTYTTKDGSFTLQNTASTTKQAKFSLASITAGQTRTFTLPDTSDTVVTLAATQTLTNKTLTSPTISAPTITNATITADTLAGFSSSTSGTVYGISVTTGTIGSAALAANSVTSSAIATNAVAAAALATNAITLGYAQITSNVTSASGTQAQAAGLTVTVTIPAGGRKIKITINGSTKNDTANHSTFPSIWDGVVGSGTQLKGSTGINSATTGSNIPFTIIAVVTPSAGSKTYNVGYSTDGAGTGTLSASATDPACILVEAI